MVQGALVAAIALLVSRFKIVVPGVLPFKLDVSLAVVLAAALLKGAKFGLRVEIALWLMSVFLFSKTFGLGETVDFMIAVPIILCFPRFNLKFDKALPLIKVIFLMCLIGFCWGMVVNLGAYPVFMKLFMGAVIRSTWITISLLGGAFCALKVALCCSLAYLLAKKLGVPILK